MKRIGRMVLTGAVVLIGGLLLNGCIPRPGGTEKPDPSVSSPQGNASAGENYAVRTVLRELTSVVPEQGIGVYGRYTELAADGEIPEVLAGILAEANTRAKENVESRAEQFLAENAALPAADSDVTDRYRYRNISCITNVTRADGVLYSILETEMESGLGKEETVRFHASVYAAEDGRLLALSDFLQDPERLPELLEEALRNKYGKDGLYAGGEEMPAWTADYLGLHFYIDKTMHVSIPYTALDGPEALAAAAAPESFIARIEKNTEYALPHDNRTVRVEKAPDSGGNDAYRIVVRDGKDEKAWWLEYAGDSSEYYVFRAGGKYYFYRLEDAQDEAFVYDFASPDGGFDRFANQNAQCFDSFLRELSLAVPCNPDCVHMRERARKYMDGAYGLNTTFVPNGHYAFRPEQGRGRTWLHFALIDDKLALDTGNVGCRLLQDISATALDEEGNETGEIIIPAGEVIRFLRLDGEGERYYYMSPQYSMYQSGARDYRYDCAISDEREVRLVTRMENSFFVDGMYLDRIGEPVTLGAARYETGAAGPAEHSVEIGGKEYKLITDLSLKTEAGEEIDFDGDVWWIAEHYVGAFSSEEEEAQLVISGDGEARFTYQGTVYTGKLPEKRYYRRDVEIPMEAEYESRTFTIRVEDELPPHDPSFSEILFWSEGEPATNEPSRVPPIEVELVREE